MRTFASRTSFGGAVRVDLMSIAFSVSWIRCGRADAAAGHRCRRRCFTMLLFHSFVMLHIPQKAIRQQFGSIRRFQRIWILIRLKTYHNITFWHMNNSRIANRRVAPHQRAQTNMRRVQMSFSRFIVSLHLQFRQRIRIFKCLSVLAMVIR